MSQQAVEVRHAIYALARRGYLPTHIEKELQVDRRVVLRWYFRWKKGLPATDAKWSTYQGDITFTQSHSQPNIEEEYGIPSKAPTPFDRKWYQH